MIVHIDHIAITTLDLEKDIQAWESYGYTLRYVARGVPNAEIKKPFMHEYTPSHDIAFLDREGAVSVELISYGHVMQVPSRCEPASNGMTLASADPENSKRFWETLGFKNGVFESPISPKFTLTFAQSTPQLPMLDDAGCTGLGLVTTDMEGTRAACIASGAIVSNTATVPLNGKEFLICFVRGPVGEVVEIIQRMRYSAPV